LKKSLPPIISVQELKIIASNSNLIIIDASYGKNAKENYKINHIEGALFVDLDSQLSNIKDTAANGGRHPLPEINTFSKTLGQLGISPDSHVVIYDQNNGALAAARFWWMLRAVGHEKVQVLNGGFEEAVKHNYPTNGATVKTKTCAPYPIENWKLPTVTMQEVEIALKNGRNTIIDVRAPKRYSGEFEPLDIIGGHIPGASNMPLTNNLDENNLFLAPEKLKKLYANSSNKINPKNTIIHCGSGVTACHTLLALDYAGFEIPSLYVGSWSEWCNNNKPVATGEN